MAYPTYTEVAAYLLAEGYASAAVGDAKAQRLLAAAIGEWDAMVGCVPFLAVSGTKTFDPCDIQADRRGWILDLPVMLASAPSSVLSGVSSSFAGSAFALYDDFIVPDTDAPYTQLIFLRKPLFRLEITGYWGWTTTPGEDVKDAIYALCAARFTQESRGTNGAIESSQTGLNSVRFTNTSELEITKTLRDTARRAARKYVRW